MLVSSEFTGSDEAERTVRELHGSPAPESTESLLREELRQPGRNLRREQLVPLRCRM